MNVAFIVERPLQILIALAIVEQLHDRKSKNVIFMIADSFHDAEGIYHRINASYGDEIEFRYFSSYSGAIEHSVVSKFDELFIHWDVGFGTQFRLRRILRNNPNLVINTFEEGVGSYRSDIYKGVKKFLLNALGFPMNTGGSKYTNSMYVYRVKEYFEKVKRPARNVIGIKRNLSALLDLHREKLISVFDPSDFLSQIEMKGDGQCLIYMSNWNFKAEDLDVYSSFSGVKLLKLHPHIKNMPVGRVGDFLVVPNSMPAELLIGRACSIFDDVSVFHKGSSALMYIESDNLKSFTV